MTPKLLNDGYQPRSSRAGDKAAIQNGYQPATTDNAPPPPPPNTGSSVVKPKE